MNVTIMQKELEIEKIPSDFEEIYGQIKNSYKEHAANILSVSFITEVLDSCNILVAYREPVLEAAKKIRENEAMVLLVCLLEQWVLRNDSLPIEEYTAPIGEGVAYDFLHLFAALPRIPENLAYLKARKVPWDVIASTMAEYDYCVELCLAGCGRPAFNFGRLNWMNRLIHNRLIRIERFKYDLPGTYLNGVRVYRSNAGELCILADRLVVHESGRLLGSVGHTNPDGSFAAEITETEDKVIGHRVTDGMVESGLTELSKTEWNLCLSDQDPVLRIHIPSDGNFDRDTLQKSYARAREVMAVCYPDLKYKAFFCSSWLMSGDLQKLLKPTSNILGFQKDFIKVPFQSSGSMVFSFVFSLGAKIPADISVLPEHTSLQREIKKLYLNGGYIHEGAGFFF